MECPVPLIVQKNDMQGLGSAITYARRYGLMSMAGIAPEDDDGNAAAAAAPKKIDADQFVIIRNMMDETDADEAKMLQFVGAKSLEEMTVPQFDTAMSALRKKKSQSEAGK